MTDLHTHILPHMDDGAVDTAASLGLLRMEAEQGVTGVALTPHFYRNRETPEQFLARRQAAWERLCQKIGDLAPEEAAALPQLVLGAEVAWMPNLDRWDDIERLCIGESRYLLLELPFTPWNSTVIGQLHALLGRGAVTPVLAHLERYLGIQKREHIRELLDLGVPIQLSASCMLRTVERWRAVRLMHGGGSFLLASDCHDPGGRKPDLGPAAAAVRRRMGPEALEELLSQSDQIFSMACPER